MKERKKKKQNLVYLGKEFGQKVDNDQQRREYAKQYSGGVIKQRCLTELGRCEEYHQSAGHQHHLPEVDSNQIQMNSVRMGRFDADACLIERIQVDELLFACVQKIEREYRALIFVMGGYDVRCGPFVPHKIVVVQVQFDVDGLENCRQRFGYAAIAIDL